MPPKPEPQPPLRLTMATRSVLLTLLDMYDAGDRDVYGLDVGDRAGLKRGVVYPILDRLAERGWLSSTWKDNDRGPKRRYYRFTRTGRQQVKKLLGLE